MASCYMFSNQLFVMLSISYWVLQQLTGQLPGSVVSNTQLMLVNKRKVHLIFNLLKILRNAGPAMQLVLCPGQL